MSQPIAEELPPLPSIYDHCVTVYKRMEEDAELVSEQIDNGPGGVEDSTKHVLVWKGHLTKLIMHELHFSVPYYTSITGELKRMGCIKQKRRGGGNAPSYWYILHEPTEELFRQEYKSTYAATNKRPSKYAMHEQRLNEHDRLLNKIRNDYETIIDILQEKEAHSG